MHIAILTGSFLPQVGGLEWKVHHLATHYVRRGHSVVVLTTRPGLRPGPVAMPVTPNYRVIRAGWPLPGMGSTGLLRWFWKQAFFRENRRAGFDVVHSHHLGPPTAYALHFAERLDLPVVATTCGEDVMVLPEINRGLRLSPEFDRMIRDNLRRVRVVGAISRAIHQTLVEIGGAERIEDIPNGVDWDAFQIPHSDVLRARFGWGPETTVILSVGRNNVVKGYTQGLEAFARMAREHPAARYALVGRGVPELREHVDRLGIGERVGLIDQMPMAEIPGVFRSADIFFNPSLMEGFPQVSAQALASGLPCVITDCPGGVDAADHGGAVVTRRGDIQSMADALSRLLSDAPARQALGEQAHVAGRHYDWRTIGDRYLTIFDGLLATGGRSA